MASPGSQAKDRQQNATRNSRTGQSGNANRDGRGGLAATGDAPSISRNVAPPVSTPTQRVQQGSPSQRPTSGATMGRDGFPIDKPGGGTSTTWNGTPGSVQSFPDADAEAVAGQALKALPGGGLWTAAEMLNGGPLIGDPGIQRGYQPDRFKGQANLTGVGDPGTAGGLDPYEREIVGKRFSDTFMNDIGPDPILTPTDEEAAGFSDVTLSDRRRPRADQQALLKAFGG